MTTLLDKLTEQLGQAAKGNSHTAAPAAAVLWPDKDRQWQAAIPALKKRMFNVLELGAYNPAERCGPAIWLKCSIAGVLPELRPDGVPVIYLPGVSRTELRAIESCPRHLQPLAELQYRGVFWSQANAKDWTVSAFLSSRNGGLGLKLAADKATQEALGLALQAGVLLETRLSDLKDQTIHAEWLFGLLQPNPARSLLQWMNQPELVQQQWDRNVWQVFAKRCSADFGFDPLADGVLAAAERLAKADGKWAEVAQHYQEAFRSFPQIYSLLAKITPPQKELFADQSLLAAYPKANQQSESALRYALSACRDMDAPMARTAVMAAEKEHGLRRNWLWTQMGESPLAAALEHLAALAQHSVGLPLGQTPADLASSYQQSGWQVDHAALQALACVNSLPDQQAVHAALRAMYLPWLEQTAQRLQKAAKDCGGLGSLETPPGTSALNGTCLVFVDGLRYDVAKRLEQKLAALGKTDLGQRWSSTPSVTASGKAWCSPVADLIAGTPNDSEFEPRIRADGKPLSNVNFRKLLSERGVHPLEKHETGDPSACAWTEVGDLDHYGHEHGIDLARDMDNQLDRLLERVKELCAAGWQRFCIVTDHGWLLLPGGLPKSELALHQTQTRWGRCAVLSPTAHGTDLTFGWDWCKDVQVAYAPGVTSFIAGAEYAHGGISLQECLVPILQLDCTDRPAEPAAITIQPLVWRGLRCDVRVEGATAEMVLDIRTKPALAASTLLGSTKALHGGKASLVVADDSHIGAPAVVVVLGADGQVLQKQATIVGEA